MRKQIMHPQNNHLEIQPKISVVTVVKNAKSQLAQTIESVCAQTYKNVEYIVVDGGSTDGTLETIKSNQHNISKWVSQEDRGVFFGMNKAIDLASGEWICFLNAGDWFFCNETLEQIFSHPPRQMDVIYGHYFYRNDNHYNEYIEAGDINHLWQCLKENRLHRYWLKSLPCHQTIFTRKDVLKKHKFDTRFKIAADLHLTLKLYADKYRFFHTNIPIAIYSAGGFSQKMLISGLREKWKIIKKIQPHLNIDLFFISHIAKAQAEKLLFNQHKIYTRYQILKSRISKRFLPKHPGNQTPRESPQNNTLIFLHIPKTAGSTMYQLIRRQFPRQRIHEFNNDDAAKSTRMFWNLPDQKKKKIRAVHGHMVFGLHQTIPRPSHYITILREPIARIRSHHAFVKRTPRHYLHQQVVSENLSLEAYINNQLSTELNNGQTRLLAGNEFQNIPFGRCPAEMLEQAKKNLKNHFIVVGIQEEFEKTLMILNKKLGWEISFFSQNINKTLERNKKLDRSIQETIKKFNQLDIQLYQFAKELFLKDYREICRESSVRIPSPPLEDNVIL